MAKLMKFEDFKNRIIEKYGDNFDWTQTEKEYKNFATPITFVCKTHGPSIRTPQQFLDHGCIQCRDERKHEEKRIRTIERLNEKYKDFEYKIDFSKITVPIRSTDNMIHKVTITCEKHGEVETTLGKLAEPFNTCPCPECKKERDIEKYGEAKPFLRESNTNSLEKFLKRAREVHGDKYDYSLVPETYRTIESQIQIICPIHGPWWTYGTDHIGTLNSSNTYRSGCGCSQCGNEAKAVGRRITFEEFIRRAESYHGKGKYDYSIAKQEFEEAERKGETLYEVTIICNECGAIFKQSKGLHMNNGCGCPFCDASSKEKLLKEFLEEQGILYKYNVTFFGLKHVHPLKADFYLPEYDIVIEYNGRQHYQIWEGQTDEKELEVVRCRDFKKKKFLERRSIEVIKYSFKDNLKFIKDNIIKTLRTRTPKSTHIKGDNIKPITPFYKRFNKRVKPSVKRNTISFTRKKNTNLTRVRKRSFKNILKM